MPTYPSEALYSFHPIIQEASQPPLVVIKGILPGPVNPRPPTTVNLQATSDNKRKVNVRARVRGRAFEGARSRARAQPTALVYFTLLGRLHPMSYEL